MGASIVLACAAVLSAHAQSLPFPLSPSAGDASTLTLRSGALDTLARSDTALVGPISLPGGGEVHLELRAVLDPFRATDVYVDGVRTERRLGDGSSLWRASVLGAGEDSGESGYFAFSRHGSRGWLRRGDELYHLMAEPGPGGDWGASRSRWRTERELRSAGAAPSAVCGNDELPAWPAPAAASLSAGGRGELHAGSLALLECEIAIETDYQYFDLFDDLDAAEAYLAALLGAASDRYAQQIGVVLTAPYVGFYTTADDPWLTPDAGGCFDVLYEFQGIWGYGGAAPVAADLYHFVSGASLGCGVAWVGSLCDPFFAFAVSGNIHGGTPFPVEVSTLNWDFIVFTHEIGHNFSAPHTHDWCPEPVDACPPSEYWGYCQTEQVCSGEGTLMSYCHLCDGGYVNHTTFFHPLSVSQMRFYAEYTGCVTPFDGGLVQTMPSCTVNAGTLQHAGGEPVLGGVLDLEVDDGQAPGVTVFLPFSFQPADGWPPCGQELPGLGELLLGIAPPNPAVIFGGGSTWGGATPVEFHLVIPPDPTLQGSTLYSQALFADLAGVAPGEPFRLTGGLSFLIGA
ncbi:MAG: M12 family metallo-peptidase [Planctomycetota bacterium]